MPVIPSALEDQFPGLPGIKTNKPTTKTTNTSSVFFVLFFFLADLEYGPNAELRLFILPIYCI